jgi:hypothetical protein
MNVYRTQGFLLARAMSGADFAPWWRWQNLQIERGATAFCGNAYFTWANDRFPLLVDFVPKSRYA